VFFRLTLWLNNLRTALESYWQGLILGPATRKVGELMHSGISKRAVLLLAVLAAVLVASVGAGGGTSATTTTRPPNPLTGLVAKLKGKTSAQREQLLHTLAAQEGEVDVYTSLSALITGSVQKAWAARYPDVKLVLYRGSSEDVTARVLSERNAGAPGADIIETNGTNMLIFQGMKNVLVPYTASRQRIAIPAKYRFDTWTADRLEKFVVAWNTNLVKDPPRTFQDLTDPKWKGKIAIEPTDVDWFAALYTYFTQVRKPHMSTAAADAMFKAIAANAQIINGHTAQATALAAGQIQVIVSGHAQSVEQLQARKAPLAFGPPFVTPVVERPQGMGVAYRLRHKAAALLFYEFMLNPASDGGQAIMLANGVEPARTDFNDSAFASHPRTYEVDERPIVSKYRAWSKKFAQILGTG
jgi:iron(III) transport system substrate-binding protein